eukprot:41336-Ditylum_brightwellii.AAC.1
MILEQANELEEKKKRYGEQLSKKEEEILAKSKALEEKDALAKEAQKKQDDLASELSKKDEEIQAVHRSLDDMQHQLTKINTE